jgi:hypothetical protein
VSNETPFAGATGIPAERVSFVTKSRCLSYFLETPPDRAAIAVGVVRRQTGKDPTIVASYYRVSELVIPAGEIQATGPANHPMLIVKKSAGTLKIEGSANVAGASDLISELARFYPGGVVEIDPANVVASWPAERYEVLPSQAGLLQLVQNGALTRNRSGEFLIHQKIRFPAGLSGAQQVKFLLLRGVPKPEGDPGHSEVISEETGEPIKFEKPPG